MVPSHLTSGKDWLLVSGQRDYADPDLPTNPTEIVPVSLAAAAKAAIEAGDRASALALLDSLRARPPDQPRELTLCISAKVNGRFG